MTRSNPIQLEPEHLYAIEGLAEETNRPVEEVKMIYAEELGNLSSDARIQDYLVVLTSKKVRDVLRTTSKLPKGFTPWKAVRGKITDLEAIKTG